MSMQTWLDEFYKKEPSEKMSKRKSIEHSLLKWTGLLKKNLKKHDVFLIGAWLQGFDNDELSLCIDSDSCALCLKYLNGNPEESQCEKCPLYKYLDNTPCDTIGFPYEIFRSTGDPKPMIRALMKLMDNYANS